jgi:hypothetical protein
MAKRDLDLLCSHSVEEAEHRHRRKVVESRADVASEKQAEQAPAAPCAKNG